MPKDNIKSQLEDAISRASKIEPKLAKRLKEIRAWIKNKKEGQLTSKKFVMMLLRQLIKDSQVWLDIKESNSDERQVLLEPLSAPAKYWHTVLFPRWVQKPEPKISKWKQKLTSGEFQQEDEDVLKSILKYIERQNEVDILEPNRLIADLSMATDSIVSGSQGRPICAQITRSHPENTREKYEDWRDTLAYWEIERGVFVNYNPREDDYISRLVDALAQESDTCPSGSYPQRQT